MPVKWEDTNPIICQFPTSGFANFFGTKKLDGDWFAWNMRILKAEFKVWTSVGILLEIGQPNIFADLVATLATSGTKYISHVLKFC